MAPETVSYETGTADYEGNRGGYTDRRPSDTFSETEAPVETGRLKITSARAGAGRPQGPREELQ